MMLDLLTTKKIFVVGIGGAGMSGIAHVLRQMGHEVSGSDAASSAVVDRLRLEGIAVVLGHTGALPSDLDFVVHSTAIAESNPDLQAARARHVRVCRRGEVLAAITQLRRTIAIAGTHGKTTTTSLAATLALGAGGEPSYLVGGEVLSLNGNSNWAPGDLLVVEADESDGTFLGLRRDVAVVTNVEPDHLDFYGHEDGLRQAFEEFVAAAGSALVCNDDEGAARLARNGGSVTTYGTAGGSDYLISDLESTAGAITFSVRTRDGELGRYELPIPGIHNARNATAAIAALDLSGIDLASIPESLRSYGGVARRFQKRGERNGVTFVDDYAHLPSEVRAVLDAAASGDWKRIVVVFQPHRYTRTRDLADEFGAAFEGADVVIVSDVYAAGEEPIAGVSGELVASAVTRQNRSVALEYCPHMEDVIRRLDVILREGDLCLTLGAGDITSLPDALLRAGSP